MSVDDEILYQFLPQLFLRAPHYSFGGYDLSRLPEVLQQQDFRNAIWLASPGFYRIIEKKDFDFHTLSSRQVHTLSKYYNRICFRPTPFGTFASFTLLKWADGRSVRIGKADQATIHVLPDEQTLRAANAKRTLNEDTELIVNPTLYRVGKHFRYSRTLDTMNSRYDFRLDAIEAVKFNKNLLALFKGEPLPARILLDWIALNGACSPAEASSYLDFLLSEQILLTPASGKIIYTGVPHDEMLAIPGWKEFWESNRTASATATRSLREISSHLGTLLNGTPVAEHEQALYAALEKPFIDGGPGPREQAELLAALRVMEQLAVQRTPPDLSKFIQSFRERFDQEKVPLLVALDEDTGIPYGDLYAQAIQPKVLENIAFPKTSAQGGQADWTAVHRLLFRLWTGDTLRDPYAPLIIKDEHLNESDHHPERNGVLPQTLAVMYRKAGENIIIESADGAAATALIGRFSCFSEKVHDLCLELAQEEIKANADVVFADISQLSDKHVDNINRRRRIYPFEIPINVFSDAPHQARLPPADLLVSVRGNELILESARLGKRVIPRLASAYNFRHSQLPLFRLLCDLQYQGIKANLTFDLQKLFPGLRYYPMVMYNKTVLSGAQWHFSTDDIKQLTLGSEADRLPMLEIFRQKYRLPRFISLGASDQQLVFDLADRKDAAFFIRCLPVASGTTIREYLLPGREVVSGHKPLAGQMIAFLKHEQPVYRGLNADGKQEAIKQQRSFTLGSDWLYLKIFCTPKIADELLVNVVRPFVKAYREQIQQWFFIRYTENGHHLRLRLHADVSNLGSLLIALRRIMVTAGYDQMIRNYQGDTYQRELERYGKAYSGLLEECFSAGSDLVLGDIKGREDEDDWGELRLALRTVDEMVRCFLPEEKSRLSFLKGVSERFIREFSGDKELLVSMDAKYREIKPLLATLDSVYGQKQELKIFLRRVRELGHFFRRETEYRKLALLADLIHMQLNRCFAVRQREQELLVYYILQKQMKSAFARNK